MPGWSSPAMAEVAELVRSTTGLTFPEARVADVEATIRRTMARRGISDAAALAGLLRHDTTEREAMVAELTIGETYFQRDPSQFGVLSEQILPELLARRDRPVRVWSAGCASGEEPYTVAMLFDELNALDRAQIVGTDIARQRLQDAQRGIYSKWSLRATPEGIRKKYFRERGRFYELTPRLRERVDFRYLNLAEDQFPSLSVGIWGMDVILCRNVLIYFDSATVERVARRLLASLSEDGWLILGASDPAISEMVECDVVLTSAGLVYRRAGAAQDPAALRAGPAWHRPGTATGQPQPEVRGEVSGPEPASADDAAVIDAFLAELAQERAESTDSAKHVDAADAAGGGPDTSATDPGVTGDIDAAVAAAYDARDYDRVDTLAGAAPSEELSEASWTAWLRALANQGRLDEADALVTRALGAHGSSAELVYLHGVLLLQTGRAGDAVAALRRALYLDRNLVVAHLMLADALQRTADAAGARRSLRNTESLLSALSSDAAVPASDGEAAGRMLELVRVKLRLLDGLA
jgi:chemotaxis protein methyltransferase CheR